jgi:hypothetical protein
MRRRRLGSALAVAAALFLLAPPSGGAAPAPGSFTGEGFDACTAPTSATMDTWLASSPYRAIGIYFGGSNRACQQPELTADWVSHQQANGWHLLPIYLGLQAPCTTSTKKNRIDPTQAAAQGRAEADAAVTAAGGLGLSRGSVLIFDMEAYATGDAGCRSAVLTFLGAWTSRLHDHGYFSGVYSSIASGVTDLVNDYKSTTRPHPDYLDFARYDETASTDNPAIPASYWSPHRRIHQYRGGHDETYGGTKINIDNDYVDVRPLPTTGSGDLTGNGWSDLLARDTSTGTLYLYPGNGTNLESRIRIGGGWGHFGALTRFGDFTGDGREDLIARDSATGYLWLYPGAGTAFGARVLLGGGWNAMREITAVGDLNGDGHPDLVADRTSTGYLYFYPGTGTRLGSRVSLGPGWNAMSELTGVGDLTGDGRPDLLARNTASGTLYLYPGKGVGFGSRISLGTGWSGRRDLVGVGDFNRDGHPDLLAVDSSPGALYLYPGKTGGFSARVRLSTGWGARSPLA